MTTRTDLEQRLARTTDPKKYDELQGQIRDLEKGESLRQARETLAAEEKAKAELEARHQRFEDKLAWVKGLIPRAETIDEEILASVSALYWLADERGRICESARGTLRHLGKEAKELGLSTEDFPAGAIFEPGVGSNDATAEEISKAWLVRFADWHRAFMAHRGQGVIKPAEPITLTQMRHSTNTYKAPSNPRTPKSDGPTPGGLLTKGRAQSFSDVLAAP